jgi:hypothetical protein
MSQPEQTTVPAQVERPEPWHLIKARAVFRTIEAFGWQITWTSSNPIPDDAWPIDIIARALLEAASRH